MFFDTQFAYESFSLVLFIWTLAAIARFTAPSAERATVGGWFVAGLIFAFACVVTHHLATYALVGVLIGATTLSLFTRGEDSDRRQRWRLLAIFTALLSLASVLWAYSRRQMSSRTWRPT